MGYSISQEQHEKLERNRAEGRLCCVSTGRGGCFNRATVRQTVESWYYEKDRLAGEPPHVDTQVICASHSRGGLYDEGTNFRVLAKERF
jgi:hypothetical protein